jgi:hypothetical protein
MNLSASTMNLSASNMNLLASTMNLSASNINLSATNMSFRGRTDINTIGSTNTNIGTGTNTGIITIGNAASSGLNIGEPITPTYSYTAAIGTGIVETIGYVYDLAFSSGTSIQNDTNFTSGTGRAYAIQTVGKGVWLISTTMAYSSTTNTLNFYAQVGMNNNSVNINQTRIPHPSYSNTWYQSITGITVVTTSANIDVGVLCSFTGTSPAQIKSNGFKCTITRIA